MCCYNKELGATLIDANNDAEAISAFLNEYKDSPETLRSYASKLRAASAHWLRHSYVTYLLDSDAPLKVAQENAGHSDVGTTMLYRHV